MTPKDRGETGFAPLRAQGIDWLQAVSGSTWTDHNLHDPGITLLEQLCFALTDVAYRAGFPVADHLTGADGRIAFEALSLHPPAQAFPCRATTAADVRRVLLDAVPGLDDATLQPREDGVVRLVLKLSQGAAESTAQRIEAARAAFLAQRNLGEDLDPAIGCVADVPCELHGSIEIAGPRDAADVLAEVYDRCDRFIARAATCRSLDERLRAGASLEQVYTGPALQHGFIDDLPAGQDGTQRLFLSDLAAVVQAVPGVELARLAELRPANAAPSSGSVAWRSDAGALRLVLPNAGASGPPATLAVTRRGNPVHIAPADLCRKLEDLRAAGRSNRARQQADQAERAAAALPRGEHRELQHYHSVQQLLPAVYGVGRHGVPRSAPPQERARAQQLQTYLLMMEQVIAQELAQLQHLRELFSVNGGSRQALWSQLIGPDSLPGVDRLLLAPPAEVEQAVYAPFDRHAQRKSRALDHLLALHGETYTQNSMRQFCGHHAPQELEALLLENKAAYLRDIVRLTRDRAAGFDPGRPPGESNCSGLQRRASLLLGFRIRHPRALTQVLRQQQLALVAEPQPRHTALQVAPELAQAGVAAGQAERPASREQLQADLQRMPALQGPLPQALFRAGLWRDRYRVLESAPHRLVLGPDEQGRWWHLGEHPDAGAARRAAGSLRLFLLHLHQESEGMHVVEHVLLRPLAPGGQAHARLALPAGFHALRVSVLLPGWTARTAQPAFRRFAQDTLRINCPSHLSLQCLWLDFDAMQRFEACWEPWLAARRALAAAPGDRHRAEQADAAACRVIECLRQPDERRDGREEGEGDEPFLQGHA